MAWFANLTTRFEFRVGLRLYRLIAAPNRFASMSRSVTDVLRVDERSCPSAARYFTLVVTCCSSDDRHSEWTNETHIPSFLFRLYLLLL